MASRPLLFGEVLFDHFPDGRRVLGGAPFNVAWHLQAFGQRPLLISAVGDDPEGAAVREAMGQWSMDDSALQIHPRERTGRVQVSIEDDEPHYQIVRPVAWDRIEPLSSPAPDAGLLYHGSLALRDGQSCATLERLRAELDVTVFLDVNLRPPWYDREQVLDWLLHAHWAKLNTHEFAELKAAAGMARGEDGWRSGARDCLDGWDLEALIVTLGPEGALLLTRDGAEWEAPAASTSDDLVDTVGAGDAFSSVIILGLLLGWEPEHSLRRALDFAAAVCGQRGATTADPAFYEDFTRRWNPENPEQPRV